MTKKIMLASLLALWVGSLSHQAFASGIPGGTQSAASSIKERTAYQDSRGKQLANLDVGFKVYVIDGVDTVKLVTDEVGTAPTSGTLHAVCIGSGTAAGTDQFTVFDRASITGNLAATDATLRLIPVMTHDTNKITCATYDAQFHYGLVGVGVGGNSQGRLIYWRPSSSGTGGFRN